MLFRFWLLLLVGISAGATAQAVSTALTLQSTHVDLPTGDRLFSGPGAEVMNDDCLACHSASMVLDQPVESRETWQRIVEKMRNDYHAPIAEADVPAIVTYLAEQKGEH
jgi:cytochrome c1